MTWESFTLDGVTPEDDAVHTLQVEAEPLDDWETVADAAGASVSRITWAKSVLRMSGTGIRPLELTGVDFDIPVTLNLYRYASGTWTATNITVLARPPRITEDLGNLRFAWTMECVEVNATVLHSLPFVFTLGGVTPRALAVLTLDQQIAPLAGSGLLRFDDGSALRQQAWRKLQFQLNGTGWVELNDFNSLSYSGSLTLQISRLASVDANGVPTYATTNYTVLTDGPTVNGSMVDRRWSWSLSAVEA